MVSKLKENIIAFIIALALTGAFIAIISSNSQLATDILWKKTSQEKVVDMKFVLEKNTAKLVSNKNIENVASVSLELLFNKEKVKLSKDNIDSNYNLSLAEKTDGNGLDIILTNVNQIKKQDIILEIKNITKEQFDNINIGQIKIYSNNWEEIALTSEK